ncbi:OB-fold nucleic acid binding domain-containing protein [Lactiplantibacillus plantarum]
MAFATGSDLSGEIDLTISQTYQRIQAELKPEAIVLITGKVEQQRDLQVIVNTWQLAENYPNQPANSFAVAT